MVAVVTSDASGARQARISCCILQDIFGLTTRLTDNPFVHTSISGNLLMLARLARVQEGARLLVLPRVQHVVAFPAELESAHGGLAAS